MGSETNPKVIIRNKKEQNNIPIQKESTQRHAHQTEKNKL